MSVTRTLCSGGCGFPIAFCRCQQPSASVSNDLLCCPLCGEKVLYEQEEIICICGLTLQQGSLEKDSDFKVRWNTRAI